MTRLQRGSSGVGSIVQPLSHGFCCQRLLLLQLLLLLLEVRRGCCGLLQLLKISMRAY
jgi:hypothetical protein